MKTALVGLFALFCVIGMVFGQFYGYGTESFGAAGRDSGSGERAFLGRNTD